MTAAIPTTGALPSLFHLVVFQNRSSSALSRRIVDRVQELLAGVPDGAAVDVWLDSPGGDAHAAYKLGLLLRHKAARLRVVVLDYAKSAATLLVLAADEVLMGPCAELGPLDVQSDHPDREGVVVSGLDIKDAFQDVAFAAVRVALTGGVELLSATGLPRLAVLHEMLSFCAQLYQPAVAKLDVHLIHRADSDLRVATEYGKRLVALRTEGMRAGGTDDTLTPVIDAETLVAALVQKYPDHGFVISRKEGEALGLPVRPAEAHPRYDAMWTLLNNRRGRDTLLVIEDRKLDRTGDLDAEEEQSDASVADGSGETGGTVGGAEGATGDPQPHAQAGG